MRQPKSIRTSQNNNFHSQNPASTHSYQPTQMQTETLVPFYQQQLEIRKSQFTNFSQMPNAAE